MLDICARALVAFGCSPVLASTAAEALDLVQAESRRITVAIVDIVLPDMSGLELVRLLRESGYIRQVICTSGFPPSSSRSPTKARSTLLFPAEALYAAAASCDFVRSVGHPGGSMNRLTNLYANSPFELHRSLCERRQSWYETQNGFSTGNLR